MARAVGIGDPYGPEGARERALRVARPWARRPAMGSRPLIGALAVAGLACVASAAAARAPSVDVSVASTHGLYAVRGAFDAAVSDSLAWQVLTDYDHIGSFVSSIRYSAQGPGPGGRLRVTQVAEGGFFAFQRRARVVLDIQTEPTHRIFFADVLGADFRCYVGDWFIGGADSTSDATRPPGTLHIRYVLQAQPTAAIPAFVGRSVIRHAVEQLLAQVRTEMLRRAAASSEATRP